MAKIHQLFSLKEDYMRSESYINSGGPYFDFCFQRYINRTTTYGLYGYFSSGENEASYFQDLKEKFHQGHIDAPILITRNWEEKLQKELLLHYFRDSKLLQNVAFCHIERPFETKEQFSSATLMTVHKSLTLEQYVMGEAEKVKTELEKFQSTPQETPQPKEISLWQSIKGVFQ